MAVNVSGTSVLGRQIIATAPANWTDVSVILTTAAQGQQYLYKGTVSLEDFFYTRNLQLMALPVYWEGVQFFERTPFPYQLRVVAYWRFAGLAWNVRINP